MLHPKQAQSLLVALAFADVPLVTLGGTRLKLLTKFEMISSQHALVFVSFTRPRFFDKLEASRLNPCQTLYTKAKLWQARPSQATPPELDLRMLLSGARLAGLTCQVFMVNMTTADEAGLGGMLCSSKV